MFPAGGQRGKTIEATIVGQGLSGATALYISAPASPARSPAKRILKHPTTQVRQGPRPSKAPAKLSLPSPDQPKPWYNSQMAGDVIRVSIAIAADAALGERDLRLVTPGGPSQRCRLIVGDMPEEVVTKSNFGVDKAVEIKTMPLVVNGQLYSGWIGTIATMGAPDSGHYRISAKAGQTLVCELQARTLKPYIEEAVPGWLDACLTLYEASGRRLKYVDDFGTSPDPVLFHKVDKDAEYLLEVRDVIYRSNHDFVYRLRVGPLPYVTHIFPLGGRRGTEVAVETRGVNLSRDSLTLKIPADSPAKRTLSVTENGIASNGVPFAVDDLPEVVESEPNDSLAKPQRISVPAIINGRIGRPGDVDYFVFQADADQKLVLEVQSRRLGSPLDSILTLFDVAGKQLDENDDDAPQAVPNSLGTGVEGELSASVDPADALVTHQADSRLVFKVAATGDYVVRIADVADKGGEEYAYRLKIAAAQMDFTLRVKSDVISAVPGDAAMVGVNALRKNDFDGPIRVEVQDLPSGFTASPAVIAAGETDAQLTISVPAGAEPGFLSPRFVGKAEIDGKPVQRAGIPVETVTQAFYIKHMVPTQACLLNVGANTSFSLTTNVPPGKELELQSGSETKIVVQTARLAEGKGPINISAVSPPPGVTVKGDQVAADKDETTISVTITPKAAADVTQYLIISGTLRSGKQTTVRTAPAIPFKVVKNK